MNHQDNNVISGANAISGWSFRGAECSGNNFGATSVCVSMYDIDTIAVGTLAPSATLNTTPTNTDYVTVSIYDPLAPFIVPYMFPVVY